MGPLDRQRDQSLQVGDRVRLFGGYDPPWEWLGGRDALLGSVVGFIPGQNEQPAAVVRLDEPLSFRGASGDVLVLELRYVGATWGPEGVVHLELLAAPPDAVPFAERCRRGQQGTWVESHASYALVASR